MSLHKKSVHTFFQIFGIAQKKKVLLVWNNMRVRNDDMIKIFDWPTLYLSSYICGDEFVFKSLGPAKHHRETVGEKKVRDSFF